MAKRRRTLRYPNAVWRPTDKHGYGNDDNCLQQGIVAHSMEGSLQAAFGELDRPDRQASWHFSVAKSGAVYQHIETENISYASGSYEANRRYWSIEHEGRAGEPLTDAQRLATTALMGWLLSLKGLVPSRIKTLFEHNEMAKYGAAPTACPSGRIPWDAIIKGILQEVEVPSQAEWDAHVQAGETRSRQIEQLAKDMATLSKQFADFQAGHALHQQDIFKADTKHDERLAALEAQAPATHKHETGPPV